MGQLTALDKSAKSFGPKDGGSRSGADGMRQPNTLHLPASDNAGTQRYVTNTLSLREPTITARPDPALPFNFTGIPLTANEAALRVQAKLEVGSSTDPLEREADAVAHRVMRMSDTDGVSVSPALRAPTAVRRACDCGGTCSTCQGHEDEATGQKVQRKAEVADVHAGLPAPPSVHHVLRSPGQSLDTATRRWAGYVRTG
jgi:hypothetical protein